MQGGATAAQPTFRKRGRKGQAATLGEDGDSVTSPMEAPDIEQVLKHNRHAWAWHVTGRTALGLALIASSFLLHVAGAPDSFFTVLPVPAGFFVLLFLTLRTRHGRRLAACERVLRTYPLEYRTRVDKKSEQWRLLGSVFTVKVSTRGQHGAPLMRAINASTVRRWPMGAEEGGARGLREEERSGAGHVVRPGRRAGLPQHTCRSRCLRARAAPRAGRIRISGDSCLPALRGVSGAP